MCKELRFLFQGERAKNKSSCSFLLEGGLHLQAFYLCQGLLCLGEGGAGDLRVISMFLGEKHKPSPIRWARISAALLDVPRHCSFLSFCPGPLPPGASLPVPQPGGQPSTGYSPEAPAGTSSYLATVTIMLTGDKTAVETRESRSFQNLQEGKGREANSSFYQWPFISVHTILPNPQPSIPIIIW